MTRADTRARLAADVAAYLAQGGEINAVPLGATALLDGDLPSYRPPPPDGGSVTERVRRARASGIRSANRGREITIATEGRKHRGLGIRRST